MVLDLPPEAYQLNIYNSRNLSMVLDQKFMDGCMSIYNSRNLSMVLDNHSVNFYCLIYNSRNLSMVLDFSWYYRQ